MTPRTIRNWLRRADTPRRPAGRPKVDAASDAAAFRRALKATKRVLRRIGRTAGEPAVRAALAAAPPPEGPLSTRLVRRAIGAWKAHEAKRTERRERAARVEIETPEQDTLWSADATHLGRTAAGAVVAAEVVRDVGACAFLVIQCGPPATARRVIDALTRAAAVAGTWPLVFASDNGAPYKSVEFAAFLAAQGIVHLRNAPRTPQHNAWSERGIGELKREAGLGARPPTFRLRALGQAAARLNRRPRASRKLLTADELRRSMGTATTRIDRALFYAAARAAVAQAVHGLNGARARRRAEREAIFQTMERFNLITRYRGGVPITAPKAETIT